VHLPVLPLGVLLENVAGLYATLVAAGTYRPARAAELGLGNPFQPDFPAFARAIADLRPSSLILVPELLAGLVAVLGRSGTTLPSLSLVAVGGGAVAPALLERATILGLPVLQGYGLTECGSVVSLEDRHALPRGSVGRSLGHVRISVDQDGEIIVTGPLHLGTVGAPRQPGPLRTGDIGFFDRNGRLWVTGRKSGLIVTSYGRNISPEWIETLLTDEPEIRQAMVYGSGKPAPEVLIVSSDADASLGDAVARVNAALPDYAAIAGWRRTQPFTVKDGTLTPNGRLRRHAILRRQGLSPES
jgi:acyl-CoA synthetase (AMP-forming)/AMP-acid ligase II